MMAGSPLHTRFSANINQSVFLIFFFLTNDDFLLTVLFVKELQRCCQSETISGSGLSEQSLHGLIGRCIE
jgi:hypothetical protein